MLEYHLSQYEDVFCGFSVAFKHLIIALFNKLSPFPEGVFALKAGMSSAAVGAQSSLQWDISVSSNLILVYGIWVELCHGLIPLWVASDLTGVA